MEVALDKSRDSPRTNIQTYAQTRNPKPFPRRCQEVAFPSNEVVDAPEKVGQDTKEIITSYGVFIKKQS